MAAKWPGSVATDADLFVAKNALATTLASTITNSDTTISLTNTTNFPVAGAVTIDQEIIFYTNISGSNLTGCVRGSDGTSIAGHNAGVPVSATIIAFHHNGLMAEIEAIESWLTTNVVASPLTANLPAAGYKLTGLGAGSTAGDSLRYEQVIGQFLLLSGGTMTGNIAMSGTQKLTGLAAGSSNGDSIRYEQLFGQFLPLSGGILTGTLTTAQILINGATLRTVIGGTTVVQIDGTDYSTSGQTLIRNSNDTGGSSFILGKSRGTTVNSVTSVTSGDTLGTLYFVAADGTGVIEGARIRAKVDGTPGTNDMPTRIEFLVCPDGSATPVICGQFDSTGAFSAKGTTTNNSAASGYIGEYIESVVGVISAPTSTQYGDLTSISLTAGDWDVTAVTMFNSNGATWSACGNGISVTSGNSGTGLVLGSNRLGSNFASSSTTPIAQSSVIPSYRMSLSSTTTVYLKFTATYSAGTPQTYGGRISARRVR
jgi:hypothetical protein